MFFNDTNYYFEFADNQILVKPDDSSALLEEQSLHMFRCMILMGTEHISGNQQIMEININGQQEMAIPLFYLKYIDDKKATDNLVTGIQIGVDIALTLAPIGNLSKLKHITRLTKFGRAIAGKTIVEGPGEVLLRLELAQGVVSAVEITAGLASIYYNYAKQVEEVCDVTSSQYDQEKCINYRRLADLFMYIGLVNGVLDVVAARKVKNVAKEILDSPIANTLDIDVYTILRKSAEPLGDAIEATNTFWVYVRDPKNKELLTQGFIDLWENTNIWTEALRTKFITDFSTEVGQLRYFQTEEMLTRWRKLATRDIPLSGNIKFLQDPVAANRMVELFDSPMLKSMYTVLLDTKTRTESLMAFLRKFDDLGATYYQKFADDTDLVKSWFRYFDIPEIKMEYNRLNTSKQLEFLEEYGNASEDTLIKFRKNQNLINDWNEITTQFIRKDIELLLSYNYVKRPYVIDKLVEIKSINGKWVGGHLADAFNPQNDIYATLDNNASVFSVKIGNRTYKQVKQTSITMTDGKISKRKSGVHTWIEGATKQEFKEDLAYAFNKKIEFFERLENDGSRAVLYKSSFQDGTKVTIIIKEPHWIDEYDTVFSNHFSAILIEPVF